MADTPERILLVRLGALGDIIHALPVAAALRRAFPSARIDWLVSAKHRDILRHVPVIDRRVIVGGSRAEHPKSDHSHAARVGPPGRGPGADQGLKGSVAERAAPTAAFTSWRGVAQAIGELREADYDIAFDLQGLLKSAILARSSGARRVVGFAVPHVRERWAHLFYTETVEPPVGVHVVDKNLALLGAVGLHELPREFPLQPGAGEARTWDLASAGFDVPQTRTPNSGRRTPDARFALFNPGAGWPNKRWPPERFGAIAEHLRSAHSLMSIVLWGPGEESLAREVVEASHGAARLAGPTGIGDMVALTRAASLFVSGDTGPLHIAAAVGTPIVGIYGPTSPARNGPWDAADICVSRFDACHCHHRRRCRLEVCCLLDIGVDEVRAAIDRRLAAARAAGPARGPRTADQGPAPGAGDPGPGTVA